MAEGSFPKDLYFGGDYDSEGQSGPSAEKIPRLLLMGMRRFVVVSFDSFYLSYILLELVYRLMNFMILCTDMAMVMHLRFSFFSIFKYGFEMWL